MFKTAKFSALGVAALAAALAAAPGCGQSVSDDTTTAQYAAQPGGAAIGLQLQILAAHGQPELVREGLVSAHVASVGGQQQVVAEVLIEGSASAIPALEKLGVKVRTVTSNGIMTASLPLPRLAAAAQVPGVTRIVGARKVKMYNDRSNGMVAGTHSYGMNNDRSQDGSGVVVGVIDSGLDWTHDDFRNEDGSSRIAYYWDQSDTTDSKPPAGYGIGREYTAADFDAYNGGNTSAVAASAQDTDGHGTHVTGTAAGNGRASKDGQQYKGVAPKAKIVFVKFDFDGSRNATNYIIDGVKYIFEKAAQMGLPAAINMSLGSDYGPADGTSAEERGIDDLTGPGKVVVVAAGNPGANNWSGPLAWGYALHGKGTFAKNDPNPHDTITFRYPQGITTKGKSPDYAFFDIWHNGGTCKVTVGYEGSPLCTLSSTTTVGRVGSCRTGQGQILIGQSSDVLGFESTSGDTEVYVELPPAVGTWSIDLTNCTNAGEYHAKYGASSGVIKGWQAESPRDPTPRFGGRESDNAYTIGNPASANKVIAVAAYQSRESWQYVYGTGDAVCNGKTEGTQSYGVYPISYYDPYSLGELAYFSGRGPRRDGVVKPEIATPGVGIASAFSSFTQALEDGDKCTDYFKGGYYHYGTNRVLPGEKYMVIQGTSMACPNATGAIALLLEKKPDLDAAQLRTLFSTTARVDDAVSAFKFDKDDSVPGSGTDTDNTPATPNNDWGYGKLDIAQSLAALPSKCGADPVNACGGCGALSESPGDSCNACGTGTIQCAGPDATACATPSETCDGVDNDCDGDVDEDLGSTSCGVGACEVTVASCSGGQPTSCTPLTPPEASETSCSDGVDNDCDGKADGADSDCAAPPPTCTKGASGAPCSKGSDCCSGKCTGKPGSKTCN